MHRNLTIVNGIVNIRSYVLKLLIHPKIHFYWKRMHFVLKNLLKYEYCVQLKVLKLYFILKSFSIYGWVDRHKHHGNSG